MRAYKFRSASQIAFTLDIIFNRRLFCSDWKMLNDPMEGMFVFSHQTSDGYDYKKEIQQIIEEKKRLKVCSSATYESHLLWAHYAGGLMVALSKLKSQTIITVLNKLNIEVYLQI